MWTHTQFVWSMHLFKPLLEPAVFRESRFCTFQRKFRTVLCFWGLLCNPRFLAIRTLLGDSVKINSFLDPLGERGPYFWGETSVSALPADKMWPQFGSHCSGPPAPLGFEWSLWVINYPRSHPGLLTTCSSPRRVLFSLAGLESSSLPFIPGVILGEQWFNTDSCCLSSPPPHSWTNWGSFHLFNLLRKKKIREKQERWNRGFLTALQFYIHTAKCLF